MTDKYIKILCLLLFHTTFVYLDDGSGVGRIIQAVSLGVLILMMLNKHQLKLRPDYKTINYLVVTYCIALIIISYVSKGLNAETLDRLNFGSVAPELRLSSYTLGIMMSLVTIQR